MGRELKFKAKRLDNGRWVEGYYYSLYAPNRKKECNRIMTGSAEYHVDTDFLPSEHDVNPKTVCQSSEMNDVNGKPIFENDIIEIEGKEEKHVVVFYEGSFCYATKEQFKQIRKGIHPYLNDYTKLPQLVDHTGIRGICKVVGNIFD